LFSGRSPFVGKSFDDFAKLHHTVAPPKLSRLVPDLPKKLELIIEKALQKKPEDRFQSVRQMLDYLQTI
jgi:serine/threonine-protein kinase